MFNKKLLLILGCTLSTITVAMQIHSGNKKDQLSAYHCVTIQYQNASQAQEIKKDILALYADTHITDSASFKHITALLLNASEADLRQQFKGKSWYQQIIAIEGDCYTCGADKE